MTPEEEAKAKVDAEAKLKLEEEAKAKADVEKNRLPYHEDPDLQDYINRMVEKRVAESIQKSYSKDTEEYSDIVAELTSEFELSPELAKKYAKIIEKVAERVSEKKMVGVQSNLKSVTLQHKVSNFSASHPDLAELKDDMLETLNKLPKDEQEFIRNSENGIEYLYNKVKLRKLSILNPSGKASGGSPLGGGKSREENSTLLQKAQQEFSKGNVQGYNQLMKEYNSSKV